MAGIDARSQDWRIISEWAEGELVTYRELLETPGANPVLTEGHRLAIKVLKELLALPNSAAPVVPQKSANNYDMGV